MKLTMVLALGMALVLVPLAWAYLTNRIRLHVDPAPPFNAELRGDTIPKGLVTTDYAFDLEPIAVPYDDGRGGALAASDNATYYVARNGGFFALDGAAAKPITLRGPFDPRLLDAPGHRNVSKLFFGVRDALITPARTGSVVFVSALLPDSRPNCVSMLVSSIELVAIENPSDRATERAWRELFNQTFCLKHRDQLGLTQASGAIEVADNSLYVAVGHFRALVDADSNGLVRLYPEAENRPHATINAVDLSTGNVSEFARGFRNVGGLAKAEAQTFWVLDHGPRGGDELNLVRAGKDYGWPLISHGTDYFDFSWPDLGPGQSRDQFEEPRYVWKQSIGPSSITRISNSNMPEWEGDFLVSSLRMASLYRVRIEEGAVKFAEEIRIGRRIRDALIGHDGQVYALLDQSGVVARISPVESHANADGLPQLALCAGCHQLTDEQQGSWSGPSLVGIVGRDIAAMPGYPYSETLASLDGKWTRETLDAYLANTQAFGTGSTMPNTAMSYSQRRRVIDALAGLQTERK